MRFTQQDIDNNYTQLTDLYLEMGSKPSLSYTEASQQLGITLTELEEELTKKDSKLSYMLIYEENKFVRYISTVDLILFMLIG